MKQTIHTDDLCKKCPIEFATYLKYVKKLKFEEKPDYFLLIRFFFFVNVINLNDLKDYFDLSF
jgi:hypothetical protein